MLMIYQWCNISIPHKYSKHQIRAPKGKWLVGELGKV